MSSRAILEITDGTNRADLLKLLAEGKRGKGYGLADWRPAISAPKGGGVWQDSPLSDGRQMVLYRLENAIEEFEMRLGGIDQDDVIAEAQAARLLLDKARAYWTTKWQTTPVYLKARGGSETNTRYAIIHNWGASDEANPYAQPFFACPASLMDDLTLRIERGHWQSAAPGTSSCVTVSSSKGSDYPYYLVFPGQSTSKVNCGSDAGLDNLADNAFTVETWIRPESTVEQETLAAKDGATLTDGWRFYLTSNYGPVAYIPCATTNAYSHPASFASLWDGEWHHVAMTFDDAGTRKIRIFVDGVEITYDDQQTGVGVIGPDASHSLILGNRSDGLYPFKGDMGWTRVSNSVRYTGAFTAPSRCTLPAVDGNTLGLWIREGSGSTVDNAEGTAARDGTITNCTWDGDCGTALGVVDVCSEDVFVSNKDSLAQLTHVFIYDASVPSYSPNLINALIPFNLFPTVPAVGDTFYAGVESPGLNAAPFDNLIFDIGTAQTGITLLWEYWNGVAWVALTTMDNTTTSPYTAAFKSTGVNSLSWTPPSDWATNTTVNGVVARWVRSRITAVSSPTNPTQVNRNIYTVNWPYVEIEAGEIAGDLPALASVSVYNQSSGFGYGLTNRYDTDILIGFRSVARGEDFTPFLNASDTQYDVGIFTSGTGASASFVDDLVYASTGRAVLYNPAGVQVMADRWQFLIQDFASPLRYISSQYMGTFRAILRVRQVGGTAGDMNVRLMAQTSTLDTLFFDSGDIAVSGTVGNVNLIDMGLVTYQPEMVAGEVPDGILFRVGVSNSNAAPGDLYIYELIVFPVDEWAGEFISTDEANSQNRRPGDLHVDSATDPKHALRAVLRAPGATVPVTTGPFLYDNWQKIIPGPFFLQVAARQRLYFLSRNDTGSHPNVLHRIALYKIERYYSMRGAG